MAAEWEPVRCRVVPDTESGYQGDGEYLMEDDSTDLSIPSFERVSHIDFEDDRPLRVVRFVRLVDDDEDDW